jgi:hypothetical protein
MSSEKARYSSIEPGTGEPGTGKSGTGKSGTRKGCPYISQAK